MVQAKVYRDCSNNAEASWENAPKGFWRSLGQRLEDIKDPL
jgi:hypothetical protein